MYRALLAVWLSGFLKFVPLCFSVSPFSLRFTPLICDARPLIRVSTPLISVPVPEIPVAHRTMGERPPPHGRAPTAPWAIAHRPVGDENERERNGNWGRGNGLDEPERPLAWR